MNQPDDRSGAINIRRLLITAVILILISTALLLWGRAVIREAVVIPISYLLWGFRILVQTTPQIAFWISAVLIAGLVAYHSLSGRRKPVIPGPGMPNLAGVDSQPVLTPGRAVFWANKANLLRAGQGGYAESNSHMAVVRLLVDTLAYRYRLPARTIEEQIRDGSLGTPSVPGTLGVPNLPPQVMQYLRDHLVRSEPPKVSTWALAWRSLVERAQAVWQKLTANPAKSQTDTLGAELDFILKYMEEELEVLHDDAGR